MFGGAGLGDRGPTMGSLRSTVDKAEERKAQGNSAYERADFSEALRHYGDALHQLDESGEDNEPGPLALRCTLLTNQAACHLKLQRYERCIEVSG